MKLLRFAAILALAGGCTLTPSVPSTTPEPSSMATSSPVATHWPSPMPSDAPVESSPTPVWIPCPDVGPFFHMVGTLYDEAGAVFSGEAKVRVRSMSPAQPFEAAVATDGGKYRLSQLPWLVKAGPFNVSVSIAGEKRVERTIIINSQSVRAKRQPNCDWLGVEDPKIVNFGGPATQEDPDAPRYAVPAQGLPSSVPIGGVQ